MSLFKQMADKYQERIEQVDKMFEDVADDTSKILASTSKRLTTSNNKVKTGNYRNSWEVESDKKGTETSVTLKNTAEYASHLEYGHEIVITRGKNKGKKTGKKTKGVFIGKQSINKGIDASRKMIDAKLGEILR